MSSSRPPRLRYSAAAISFHWTVFALVAVAYAAIELKGFTAKGSTLRAVAMSTHEWAGALVLVMAVPRLLVRLLQGTPAPEPSPRVMQWLGSAMHAVLYLFIIVQPVLGLLMLNAEGHLLALPSLGIEVPPLLAANRALAHTIQDIHETIGTAFYAVIGLHAVAALFHHYMLGDDTLRRMLR